LQPRVYVGINKQAMLSDNNIRYAFKKYDVVLDQEVACSIIYGEV